MVRALLLKLQRLSKSKCFRTIPSYYRPNFFIGLLSEHQHVGLYFGDSHCFWPLLRYIVFNTVFCNLDYE